MSALRPDSGSAPGAAAALREDPNDRASGLRQPKVYVVSDVLLYREGLASHLRANDRLAFMGAGPPTEETLRLLERSSPDAAIIDLAMRDSIAFAEQIRDRVRGAKTVAFAVADLDQQVVAYARAGICGYVAKDGTAEDIVTAVLHAVRGELHCTPKFAAMLLAQLAALAPETRIEPRGPASRLTPREQQILDQISQGRSNKEIARLLGISAATVKNHVHHLLEKFSVHRRTQALAVLHGQLIVQEAKLIA